ncbi:MAG: chemotaxis protein CheW [Bacillaceae bacterium]|nr:chemotaxis protein CheW [Bacillaceae bacterium]
MKAIHQENHIVITVSDDGKGIDPEKIKNSAIKKGLVTKQEVEQLTDKELMLLIFKSGFSTADKITDVSGRGVGMDIVRSQIEKLNGLIDIDSTVGGGTTFTLKLPLTLAIIRSLIVQLGEKEFALPLANVAEIVRLHSSEIKTIKNEQVGVIRDRVLPLVYMHELLGVKPMKLSKERLFVVVIGIAEKRVGLVVDQTIGNQDIVIKPLGKYIGTPPFISGATIMGEGDVSLILDVASIVNELGTKDKTLDQPINKTERNEKKRQFVTFKIGEEEYGIELQQVKDIIPVQPISHVISAPRSVVGMINLRGKVIPVIDTRIRFNLLEKEFTRKTRIIIVEHKNQLIGLIVDQVTEVLKVTESFIEAPPENNAKIDSRFFSGLCNMEQRIIVLVALAQVLNLETELAQLATDKTD